jgi:glycine betaine/proline transport system permease protein
MREPILAQDWIPTVDLGDRIADYIITPLRGNPVFLFIRDVLDSVVDGAQWLLQTPDPLVIIAIFVVVAFLASRRPGLPIFTAVAFLLVLSMGRFGSTMDTLGLVLVATVLAVVVGVPIGIAAARSRAVSLAVRPVLDMMQTMPSFIYLLIAVLFFRIGSVAGVMATFVFSMPPAVRLTELGIRQVDHEVVEAAEAFGAAPSQVLTGVQIPLARATIMAGVNQVIMLGLSMVVIAGLGGAGGLGRDVVNSITRLDASAGVESGLAVVILAIFLDRVTAAFGSQDVRMDRGGAG